MKDQAECRSCGRKLIGDAYYTGNLYARIPNSKDYAKICNYGGFVCSRQCEINACYEVESTMPNNRLNGKGISSLSTYSQKSIRNNWY